MSFWTVVGLVVLAGFAVALLLVLVFDRARKAIDALKFDTEHL